MDKDFKRLTNFLVEMGVEQVRTRTNPTWRT